MAKSSGQNPSSRLPRVARVVRLNRLLREHLGAAKACELRDELGVSKRTLQRDIRALRDAGEAVDYLRSKASYRLSVPTAAMIGVLTAKELGAFLAVTDGAVPQPGSELESAARIGRAKLRNMLATDFQPVKAEAEEWRRKFKEASSN